MKDSFYEYSIEELASKISPAFEKSISKDFLVATLRTEQLQEVFSHPIKVNGFCIICGGAGSADFTINLSSLNMHRGLVAITVPGNLIKVDNISTDDAPVLGIIAASSRFVDSMNVNFNKLYEEGIIMMDKPCMDIDQDYQTLLIQYYKLIQSLYSRDTDGSYSEAISQLVSSVLLVLGRTWSEKLNESRLRNPGRSTRTKAILEKFLSLASANHNTQKGVSFYANELCITPKYLSKLIKTESGKSAPEWIDSFVLMDAKNLLRYSNKSIKEISYTLNFSSLPAFYKFFKTKTGITPKEYRENK